MVYDAFREFGAPTMYESMKTAVTVDVLEFGIIFAILIVAVSFLLIIPGVRGKERIFFTIRWVVGLFVVGCILLCNFGQEWEVASVDGMRVQYRAGVRDEMEGDMKVKIGLRSINITLKGVPENQMFDKRVNETINYNERFSWDNEGWSVGRIGFGPFAGRFNQEFREAQLKGLPYPILWVAEFFTLDGEGARWGRHYLQAGFYSHMMIWMAFPLWVLTMILFKMVLRYGAYFSLLTGLCLISANLVFAFLRNPIPLRIVFNEDKNHVLTFDTWGSSFWLNLINGIICVIIGVVTFLMDIFAPVKLATFFNRDPLLDLEEYYLDASELQVMVEEASKKKSKFSKLSIFKSRRTKKPEGRSEPSPSNAAGSAQQSTPSSKLQRDRKGTIDYAGSEVNDNYRTPQQQHGRANGANDEVYGLDEPEEQGRPRADSSALRMYRRRTAFQMVTPLPLPTRNRNPGHNRDVPPPIPSRLGGVDDDDDDEDDDDYVNANTATGPSVRFEGFTNAGFNK